jgi:tetratricopeptide (TPR) repeat protein
MEISPTLSNFNFEARPNLPPLQAFLIKAGAGDATPTLLNLEIAVAIANSIEQLNLREEALRQLVPLLVQNGQVEPALALELANSITNEYKKVSAWSKLALHLNRVEQLPLAKSLFEQAFELANSFSDDQTLKYNLTLDLLQAGQLQLALSTINSITTEFVRAKLLSQLALHLSQLGQTKHSEQVFDLALTIARSITWDYLQSDVLAEIALRQGEAGQFQQAVDTAISISTNWQTIRVETLSKVACQLAQFGQIKLSQQLFEQALSLVNSISKRLVLRDEVIARIVPQLTQAGQLQLALDLANSITRKSRRWWRDKALEPIIVLLAQTGQLQHALELADALSDASYRRGILRQIALDLTQTGQLQHALEIINSIDVKIWRLDSLSELASVIWQGGQIELAQTILEQLITTITDLSDEWDREGCLHCLAPTLAQTGQIERALELANSISNSINNLYKRDQTLSKIALCLAQLALTTSI